LEVCRVWFVFVRSLSRRPFGALGVCLCRLPGLFVAVAVGLCALCSAAPLLLGVAALPSRGSACPVCVVPFASWVSGRGRRAVAGCSECSGPPPALCRRPGRLRRVPIHSPFNFTFSPLYVYYITLLTTWLFCLSSIPIRRGCDPFLYIFSPDQDLDYHIRLSRENSDGCDQFWGPQFPHY